jgi:hypothetical protein
MRRILETLGSAREHLSDGDDTCMRPTASPAGRGDAMQRSTLPSATAGYVAGHRGRRDVLHQDNMLDGDAGKSLSGLVQRLGKLVLVDCHVVHGRRSKSWPYLLDVARVKED